MTYDQFVGEQVESSIAWLSAVVERPAERMPLVVAQPTTGAVHDQLRRHLRSAGLRRMTAVEWQRGAWPWERVLGVDVAGGKLIRFTVGATTLYCKAWPEVNEAWLDAGRERGRALLALVPPGWISADADLVEQVEESTVRRGVWATSGALRIDAVRLRGPGWRR